MRGTVEFQPAHSSVERYAGFGEYGGPLEGCACPHHTPVIMISLTLSYTLTQLLFHFFFFLHASLRPGAKGGRTMHQLTPPTMTELGIKRLLEI